MQDVKQDGTRKGDRERSLGPHAEAVVVEAVEEAVAAEADAEVDVEEDKLR